MIHDPLNVIVYLNRGGLGNDPQGSPTERERWKYESPASPLRSPLMGEITFCFDPGNPRAMIRENRDPRKAVICVQSADFELSPGWFKQELRSALRAKSRGPDRELGDGAGEALCSATRSFLTFIGEELSRMDLAAAERRRRFGPRGNGRGETLALDLSCLAAASDADYESLLRLWWLSLDCLSRGIARALQRRLLRDDPETRAIRAPVLKLRAHLAASLLELQAADDRNLAPALHESMLEWIDFNLGSRSRNDGSELLDTRHRELGDLLFEVEARPSRWRPLRKPSARGAGDPPEARDWLSSHCIAVRKAISSAKSLHDPSGAIIDHYADSLRRAGDFFSRRYDIREMVTVSRAWFEIRSPAPGQPIPSKIKAFRARVREFARGTMRHLPWVYPVFLLFAFLPWLPLGGIVLTNRNELTLAHFGSPAHNVVSVLFGAQFSLLYLGLFLFVFGARLLQKRRLFDQAMPRLLGSLIVGYVPLWLAEETWTFPFHLRWRGILSCVAVLLIVSFLYFVVEVSRRVKMSSEALQKAAAVFLIAATQAYCIGLIITDFSSNAFTHAMPFARAGDLQRELKVDHQVVHVPSLLEIFPRPSVFASHEFLLLPKLVVFWFGLAMFVAVFLHMLWEKEGILERR
jgi:hypothetical protein